MLVIRPELPRTAAGKVQKFRLREEITLAMRDGAQAFG
jgi:acyl-CoA synthetase (AMP-forming)/AMP-acid ligase II